MNGCRFNFVFSFCVKFFTMYLLCTFMGRSFLFVCMTSVSGCSGPKRKKFFEVIISVFLHFFFGSLMLRLATGKMS
jgi:hypothetical protein